MDDGNKRFYYYYYYYYKLSLPLIKTKLSLLLIKTKLSLLLKNFKLLLPVVDVPMPQNKYRVHINNSIIMCYI